MRSHVCIRDDALADPAALARALRPTLGRHPVPQSDSRTRGLLLEVGADGDAQAHLRAEMPVLGELLARLAHAADGLYVLAVNETPPSPPDSFLLRPHVDRRWTEEGFGRTPPRWTTVAFLDFPATGEGGELAVFPPDAFDECSAVARHNARQTVADRRGLLVAPRPGRACRFAGTLPHAVLGYAAAPDEAWRTAVVLAEFALAPGDPPPRGFVYAHDGC